VLHSRENGDGVVEPEELLLLDLIARRGKEESGSDIQPEVRVARGPFFLPFSRTYSFVRVFHVRYVL
jgi:hypothetical protein